MNTRMCVLAVTLAIFSPVPGQSCSLCGVGGLQRSTVRQEADCAKIIVAGKLANPRLNADGNGTTEFQIERILKDHPALNGLKAITIPRYLPIDDKSPPFLLFADVAQGKIDVITGRFVKDGKVLNYVKTVLGLDARDRVKALQFYFQHIDDPTPEIAADACLEFAKATDAEIGRVAPKLEPKRLRPLIADSNTPAERLGMFAYLLGACGNDKDADLLRDMMRRDSEQTRSALSGLMSGYIVLRPAEGWRIAAAIIPDAKSKFLDRLAAIGVVRFFQAACPDQHRPEKMKVLAAAIEHGEVADMAIEDLRRWQWWDLTNKILEKYGAKTHESPLVQRAILRYALTCPGTATQNFVAERKKKEPDLVADALESLEAEK